jgi:hypothetical protein
MRVYREACKHSQLRPDKVFRNSFSLQEMITIDRELRLRFNNALVSRTHLVPKHHVLEH